jgi:hypothetical protein
MKPWARRPRIKRMTMHDTPSALLAGALAGYLLAKHGPQFIEWYSRLLFVWS